MWWRRKRTVESDAGTTGQEVLRTAHEFDSAERLDNETPPDSAGVEGMNRALERLRAQHLAFRRTERREESGLEELRMRILTAVTESGELEDYYKEAWAHGSPRAADQEPAAATAMPHRRVAVMQIELMVRAFYVLQLQLFANSPENHGWMTLFRSWGRSRRFNQIFDELAPTLAPEFKKFYALYVRDLPPLASGSGHLPIHHPWLRPKDARGRGLYMDSGRKEPEIEVRPGAGGQIDQRGIEGADQPFEVPSDRGDSGGGPTAPNE